MAPLMWLDCLIVAWLIAGSYFYSQNLGQAKGFYKQALHIQEKCFGASHLSVASVLYELGEYVFMS